MGSEIALGLSVVGCCRDNSTISQYVHVPAISRAPFQLHLMLVSLRLHARLSTMSPPPALTAARISTRPHPKTLFGGPAAPHWVEEIK